MKIAFFDRDGTIIQDYPDQEWTNVRQPLFIEGAIPTLKEVHNRGYKIIIITNQYILNEGHITLDQYHAITNQMLDELKRHAIEIHAIYYCPHAKIENCNCSKPKTGMIKQALEDYPEICIDHSFMIGDSTVDLELAINMNMTGFGIGIDTDDTHTKIKKIEAIECLIDYL